MTHPTGPSVDELYFEWLAQQISFPRTFEKTFREMLTCLHKTEFVWNVAGDDNRAQDGKDLRTDFVNHAHPEFYHNNFPGPASVLEVLIALSRTVAWIAGGSAADWAYRLLENLRLNNFYDPLTKEKVVELEDVLEKLLWRTYERNGDGGFFPLNDPHQDQREVEIWYQANAYVAEIQGP